MSDQVLPYYSRTDAALVAWSNAFVQILESQTAAYGLTPAQVTSLSEANDLWVACAANVLSPEKKTKVAVIARTEARRAFLAEAKKVIAIINSTSSVTDMMKAAAEIPIPKQREKRQKVDVAPILQILSREGTNVNVRITAPGSAYASKPRNASSTFTFYFVGETASTNPADWTFAGAHTTALCQVPLPSNLPVGTKVFLCASYYNSAGTGPASPALPTVIAGGGGAFGEVLNPSMKLAA